VHPELTSSLQSYKTESQDSKRPSNVENGMEFVELDGPDMYLETILWVNLPWLQGLNLHCIIQMGLWTGIRCVYISGSQSHVLS